MISDLALPIPHSTISPGIFLSFQKISSNKLHYQYFLCLVDEIFHLFLDHAVFLIILQLSFANQSQNPTKLEISLFVFYGQIGFQIKLFTTFL